MQRMIPVDKLARPEDHILVPAQRMRNARIEQGLAAARCATEFTHTKYPDVQPDMLIGPSRRFPGFQVSKRAPSKISPFERMSAKPLDLKC